MAATMKDRNALLVPTLFGEVRAKPKKANRPRFRKMVPDKNDITQYCRQDPEFREIDDFVRNLSKGPPPRRGLNAASTKRTGLRMKIMKEEPFGSVIDFINREEE